MQPLSERCRFRDIVGLYLCLPNARSSSASTRKVRSRRRIGSSLSYQAVVQTEKSRHNLCEVTDMMTIEELFNGRHFDREIIILCVRWYLRFKLSFRDLVEMMAERGIELAHTTIMPRVQRYAPEFEKRWNRFACKAGRSWRVDETYVKIKGRWTYLYCAVDSDGNTVDFVLRAKRDAAAAKAFFRRAFKSQARLPRAITLDGYQASHRAARESLGGTLAWSADQRAIFKIPK